MINYREHDGCRNCQYVFVKHDFDGVGPYCCTLNAPPRPPCLSVAMGECDRSDGGIDKWFTWQEGREVKPFGICDMWEKHPLAGIENDDSPQYILEGQVFAYA